MCARWAREGTLRSFNKLLTGRFRFVRDVRRVRKVVPAGMKRLSAEFCLAGTDVGIKSLGSSPF